MTNTKPSTIVAVSYLVSSDGTIKVLMNYWGQVVLPELPLLGLRFEEVTGNFAFSALPFKAEELENATHIEELPPERRIVLLMLKKTIGLVQNKNMSFHF